MLNAATGAVTLLAALVALLRLQELHRSRLLADGPKPIIVSNWPEYATVGARLGPRNAEVTIVEFSDFLCPYCRTAAADLKKLREQLPRNVSVVYRHVPMHRQSRQAAIAAECGARAGAFERLHDLLFEQVDSIGRKAWTVLAAESGIRDTAWFASCMTDPSVAATVSRDSIVAMRLGVEATPTFLINDMKFTGNLGLARLEHQVKKALRAAR